MEPRRRIEEPASGALRLGAPQRTQVRARISDIAWTALCVVLTLWALASSVGAVRGLTAWAYCAVAWVLLATAYAVRRMSRS